MNPGAEQNMPVGIGPSALFPDLVLLSQDRGRKLQAIVEIETGESVNHLEALAQWAHYGRVRAAFHLYVPAGMVDVARRLTEDNQIHVAEIWSYHVVGDEPRFTLVHRNREPISAQAKARPMSKAIAKRRRRSPPPPDREAGRQSGGTAARQTQPKARPAKATAKAKPKSKAQAERREGEEGRAEEKEEVTLAFLRFSRDKRGVESFYARAPTTNRRGKVRPRVLYWFRTPPDVKVGRAAVRCRRAPRARSAESRHHFDWRAIVETPIPSADADKWRERRRAERAAKHAAARAEEEAGGAPEDAEAESAASASAGRRPSPILQQRRTIG